MAPEGARPPVRSRALDLLVIASGTAVGLAACLAWVLLPAAVPPVLLLAVPVIVLMAWFPLVLTRGNAGIEIGFEFSVLVLLACLTEARVALALWFVGNLVSQALARKPLFTRAFNLGITGLAGAVAVGTMTALSDLDATSPAELGAVALGCVAYFVVDYTVSAMSVSLEEGGGVWDEVREPSALIAMGVFVAANSIGYLAATVARSPWPWTMVLLAVPLTTLLLAARFLARGSEHRRRLATLFDAASILQSTQTREAVLQVAVGHARDVVRSREVALRPEGPVPGEVGTILGGTDAPLWLVGPARNRARATAAADQQALDALGAVVDEALARLALVEEMAHVARHDTLTGLANRTLLLDSVTRAVARSRRHGGRVAVLFCDLDGFKAINDRFGHAAGDSLLVTIAQRISACVREGDVVARLGGDEFAVLLEDATEPARGEQVCVRLLDTIRQEVFVAGHDVAVSVSIGMALSAPDEDAATLLRNADLAMYHAKALGKDRFAVYEPQMAAHRLRRLELVEELRRDLAAGRFEVHYQPVVDLDTGRVDGLEALVRWRRGNVLVNPADFLEAAEQSGLVPQLGRLVLAQVQADAAKLCRAAGRPMSLAVNVSASELHAPGFVEEVAAAVACVPGATLVLEMTEHVLIGQDEATAAALRRLSDAGARIAIDDFGVGFSSLGYLQRLPVDILKIDRSFTAEVDSDPRSQALVRAIVLMGHALGLLVVAEGIERAAQLDPLRASTCHLGQGNLVTAPRPLAEMLAWLAREANGPVVVVGSPAGRPGGPGDDLPAPDAVRTGGWRADTAG